MRDYQFYLFAPDLRKSVAPSRRSFSTDAEALLYAASRVTLKLSVEVWCQGQLICKVPCRTADLPEEPVPGAH